MTQTVPVQMALKYSPSYGTSKRQSSRISEQIVQCKSQRKAKSGRTTDYKEEAVPSKRNFAQQQPTDHLCTASLNAQKDAEFLRREKGNAISSLSVGFKLVASESYFDL